MKKKYANLQEFMIALVEYWTDYGCLWSQPYDAMMGAGTFHPHTFLRGVGSEPWRAVYVQPCRRPVDGRYGESTYRFQHYYQMQVLLKPAPANILDIYLKSLSAVGLDLKENDVVLLEDDWKGPTLGAWGLGWEVRVNGQEVTQFTYFQQLGGLDVDVICGEITYGLERVFMYSQGIKNGLDIPYNDHFTYGDLFQQNEFEFSHYNFKQASVNDLFEEFAKCEDEVKRLCELELVLPAYDFVLRASHVFNLLDARGAISVSERQRYIGRVRECAKRCALEYRKQREKLNFPLSNRLETDARKAIFPKSQPSPLIISREDFSGKFEEKIKNINKEETTAVYEVGVEEMPPQFQTSVSEDFKSQFDSFWEKQKEKFSNDDVHLNAINAIEWNICVSSRRIGLILSSLPRMEPQRKNVIIGPHLNIAQGKNGEWSAATLGFCRKNGIDVDQLKWIEKSDGKYVAAEKTIEGECYATLVGKKFYEILVGLPAGLKMKWLPENISPSFVRPVRWVLAMVEDVVVPLTMFGLNSENQTSGQRILSSEFVKLSHANEYLKVLKKLGIEPNQDVRKEKVMTEAERLASSVAGKVREDNGLLIKSIGLADNPNLFIGTFDKKYLKLPKELVQSVLREHMNYFSVEKDDGSLLPHFIGVSGYACKNPQKMLDEAKAVVVGRLEDGAFYYNADLATDIKTFQQLLEKQLFQAGMGTLLEKSMRLKKSAQDIITRLIEKKGWEFVQERVFLNKELKLGTAEECLEVVGEAAALCKADLRTGCVQEFPDEMQGVMGGELIVHQNTFGAKSENVAQAIREHYLPQQQGSSLPKSMLGQIISLADKMDSLAVLVASGLDLKSNKDPFGMRRYAIGILRLVGARGETGTLPLSLKEIIKISLHAIEKIGAGDVKVQTELNDKLLSMLLERLKPLWREEFQASVVESVYRKAEETSLLFVREWLVELQEKVKSKEKDFISAIQAYKRAKNITTQTVSEKVIEGALRGVNPSLFVHSAEKDIYSALMDVNKKLMRANQTLTSEEQIEGAKFSLRELSGLAGPLENFFNAVMILDEDIQVRENRIGLLLAVREIFESFADFTSLQVADE